MSTTRDDTTDQTTTDDELEALYDEYENDAEELADRDDEIGALVRALRRRAHGEEVTDTDGE